KQLAEWTVPDFEIHLIPCCLHRRSRSSLLSDVATVRPGEVGPVRVGRLQVGIGPDNTPPAPTPGNTLQGGEAMGFYNISEGDAPVFNFIADNYAISDNYHQGIMGGTGANFFYLGTGDVGFFSDGNGNPERPPSEQIENPDPQNVPNGNDFYTQDGYGDHSVPN